MKRRPAASAFFVFEMKTVEDMVEHRRYQQAGYDQKYQPGI